VKTPEGSANRWTKFSSGLRRAVSLRSGFERGRWPNGKPRFERSFKCGRRCLLCQGFGHDPSAPGSRGEGSVAGQCAACRQTAGRVGLERERLAPVMPHDAEINWLDACRKRFQVHVAEHAGEMLVARGSAATKRVAGPERRSAMHCRGAAIVARADPACGSGADHRVGGLLAIASDSIASRLHHEQHGDTRGG
jgi:hypothetical protein